MAQTHTRKAYCSFCCVDPDSLVGYRLSTFPCRNEQLMASTKKPQDFEQSLAQLEGIVERMEQADLPIEEALKAFEQGINLTRQCQSILDQAEQKVEKLVEQQGQLVAEPFDEDTAQKEG